MGIIIALTIFVSFVCFRLRLRYARERKREETRKENLETLAQFQNEIRLHNERFTNIFVSDDNKV